VELDERETALVGRLEGVVIWGGRYPAPLKPEKITVPLSAEWPRWAKSTDFELIEQICRRLESSGR
jgi:hypothetical protein